MPILFHRSERKRTDYKTLAEVREEILAAAREASEAKRRDKLEITLTETKYTLDAPFALSAKENPELAALDVTLRAKYPGQTQISSLVRMDGKKFVQPEDKKYFVYDFVKEEGKVPLFRDFHLNFRRIKMSHSPMFRNLDAITEEERNGDAMREGFWAPIALCEKLASEPIGATELMMYIEWDFAIMHVAGIDLSKTRVHEGETYALVKIRDGEIPALVKRLGRNLNIGDREMFFMNSPAFLEENTFAYDYVGGVLYLDPENPEYTKYHALEYPTLPRLFDIEGVENITFDGVLFTGITATKVCEGLYLCGQANTIPDLDEKYCRRLPAAAIYARDTRGVTVTGCVFRGLDGNGVQFVDRTYRLTVKDSVFEDVSMCAVSVGNPTTGWSDEKNRSYGIRIENNRFKSIAFEYPASPCLYIAQVDGLSILHNTICDCAYSAMSVGWCWDPATFERGESINIRDAEIAYNRIERFMQCLKDGGAIYVLGGNANHKTTPERFNFMHDNYACAEDIPYYTGKYGYYCDGASSNWEVYHSVVLNVPILPIFSQPHPFALSYHNHFIDIYSNYPAHNTTSVPERDIVTERFYLVEGAAEGVLEAYPEAVAIRDAAGCRLPE